ncbi:MAG: 2-oxo-4-hydroxy-4-carboxy-5-ureidoimidazoline decarboxylase [Chitinophagaceae bacterium]
MSIAEFDHLPAIQQQELLTQCCGSANWVDKMLACFPVEDLVELLEYAEEKWYQCTDQDWLEAFTHHPKIGDLNSLKKEFADTAEWASDEQREVAFAGEQIIRALADANQMYHAKFGYIFIVCATGKTAEEMLTLLEVRLQNSAEVEIEIAAGEQDKITKLRLEKLFVS